MRWTELKEARANKSSRIESWLHLCPSSLKATTTEVLALGKRNVMCDVNHVIVLISASRVAHMTGAPDLSFQNPEKATCPRGLSAVVRRQRSAGRRHCSAPFALPALRRAWSGSHEVSLRLLSECMSCGEMRPAQECSTRELASSSTGLP